MPTEYLPRPYVLAALSGVASRPYNRIYSQVIQEAFELGERAYKEELRRNPSPEQLTWDDEPDEPLF